MTEYIINTESDACMEMELMTGELKIAKLFTATIDASSAKRLIRCRDCKHCTVRVFYGEVQGCFCYLTEQSTTLDDYCSRAEEDER